MFTRRVFAQLHPSEPFVPNWHVEAVCHALDGVVAGTTPKLIINLPPRYLKSICASVALPAWLLGRDPTAKIMVATYNDLLAERHSRDCRCIMESAFYGRLFPRTRIKVRRALELETTNGGFRKAVTVHGAVTGFGADYLIIDDLVKAGAASSVVERQGVKDYYTETLFSRLNDKRNGRIIVIHQRLHEDDLVGFLLDGGTFRHLNLPAIADRDQEISIGRGRVHRWRNGEALFPQREPLETLESIRREVGGATFSAQFLQNPVPPGGNRMRWHWFGTYNESPRRELFQFVAQSWDTGMTAEPTSDFSACTSWGLREGKWYLLDVHRARYDYPDLVRSALRLNQEWEPDCILIEKSGTGFPLFQDLFRTHRLSRKTQTITPVDDKVTRFEAQTAKLETGNFLVPVEAPWLEDFRRECLAFPGAKYDDQVDSMTQFLAWTGSRRGRGFTEPRTPHPQPRSFRRRVSNW